MRSETVFPGDRFTRLPFQSPGNRRDQPCNHRL